MLVEDATPYSRGDLVGAILGATFGTAILLVCIVYFLRRRSNSRYKPVQDQDTAAAEFNFRGGRDSQTHQVQLNLEPITSRGQYPSHPLRDTGAQYPTWSSAVSSGKGRNYPQIIVTSPTVPSNASFSTESHYNIDKSMYDSQHHLASSAHEDITYTGLPPRPSSPIPNRHARFGYSPVEGNDDGEFDVPYDPTSRYDTPTPNRKRSFLDKIKRGTLPAVPIKSPDAAQPSHGRTDSRAPLILANVAPQSTRPQPESEPRPQPLPQPQSQVQPQIQSTPHPAPDPPKTQPLAPIMVPSSFQPPSYPPPAVESVGRVSSEDSHSVNIQPPDAPRDKTHFSVQVPPIPVGPPHLPSSPPGLTDRGTSLSFNSQASDASVEQPALHPSPNLAFPSTSYQARPQPATKATDMSERSHTWYSAVDSSSSPSRQYSLDSPLPSSKALSHVIHGDKKEGTTADSISPDKSSPDGTTPSTGGPTPLSWEFPLPPGALPLQHTKSDPYPPASAARLPRPRTKSTLSKVVATAADVEVRNNGVVIPVISESPPESVAGSSHSHPPNGIVGQGSMGSLMAVAVESSTWARKPIPPGFFGDPKNEQKQLAPGTDMRREGVGRDVDLLSDMPMFLAGSLKSDGTPTVGQTNQPGGRTEDSTRTGTEDSLIPPDSSNSHASFLSEDENDTLERAEIRTAELAIRSPPRNVPELARFDTIHYMSDPEGRARARSRSGSDATASGSTRKRKSPDYSPPLVPPMPVDVRERRGDSSDLSSRGTSIVDSQLAAIPMSLGPTYLTSSTYPAVPWTPSPADTPLRPETILNSASSQQTTFNPTDKPPWQPLRLHSPPPRDEMRSPSTPPSVPPIPELAPISFENLMVEGPPVQGTEEEPTPAEEHRAEAEPAVVTVRAASPRSHSEVNESGWQPGHTPGSSVGTTDTFGLSATISVRGISRSRGPRPRPTHDREPSASGTSIASVILSHNTGSHGTSGSGSYNDGYPASLVDNIFGPPPPVLEQSEPDTASESHTTVPTPHKSSAKRAPRPLTPVSLPTSTNLLPQMTAEIPSSSRTSVASSTPSSSITRPRAGSTRPAVGVRGPRDRSSSARAVFPSSSGISRAYSMNQTRPVSSSSIPASQGQPPTLNPGSVAGSSNSKTDSMVTNSNNSLLDLYAQSPPRSNVPIPDPLSLQSNEHPQSHPS